MVQAIAHNEQEEVEYGKLFVSSLSLFRMFWNIFLPSELDVTILFSIIIDWYLHFLYYEKIQKLLILFVVCNNL